MMIANKKFKVGDRVVCVKNTPQVQEGWAGTIFEVAVNSATDYGYCGIDDNKADYYAFNEDELELLRASVELELPVKETIYTSALDKQIGGGHYKDKGIQPIEYIFANQLGFCEANIVKYASRWKDKGGIQDLEKVIHYAELLIEQAKKEGYK